MKKSFFILFAVCFMQTAYSQTEKGKMFIGGQFSLGGSTNSGLDSLTTNNSNVVTFSISPNLGYFIKDNLAIGVSLNLGNTGETQNYQNSQNIPPYKTTYNYNYTSYGIGLFVRQYYNITGNFRFYLNGGINYSYQTTKLTNTYTDPYANDPTIQENHANNFSINITPGLVYFITPKIGIQTTFGGLNYSYSISTIPNVSYDNHSYSSNYGLNLNISSFALGLNYYF
jgi:hypothetical protein